MRKVYVIISILVIFLILSTYSPPLVMSSHINENQLDNAFTQLNGISEVSYTNTSPISINGDADFTNQAMLNGWDGNGTNVDPFVIQNIEISSTLHEINLLSIRDTSFHFKIISSRFNGGANGIRLLNVTNGLLQNNLIENNLLGCQLEDTSNVNIINNTISSVNGTGIYLYESLFINVETNRISQVGSVGLLADYSDNITLQENTIMNTKASGISFRDSMNITIQENNVSFSLNHGIHLGNTNSTILSRNIIKNCSWNGISAESARFTNFIGNVIYHCNQHGIKINDPIEYAAIMRNTFYSNGMSGLELEATGCIIEKNNFIDNGNLYPAVVQVVDRYGNNHIIQNFYDDLTFPDLNKDDIVDVEYQILGDANSSDSLPHVFVYHTELIHILTRPNLAYPNSELQGSFVWDFINVTWGPGSDTFGHAVFYSLYYSTNSGQSWNLLESDIHSTFYAWNTSNYPEGLNYRLRVDSLCFNGLKTSNVSQIEVTILQHKLTIPVITRPNVGEIFGSRVQISWNASEDSYQHQVVYSLYYSSDNGETWILLANNLDSTYFEWVLTDQIPDADSYLVRVVSKCEEGLSVEDVSDGTFSIVKGYNPDVFVGLSVLAISIVAIVLVLFIVKYIGNRR